MMGRLAVLVAPIVVLGGLLLSGICDSKTPVADTSIPNNEVASSVSQTSHPGSVSAIISITWRTAPLPDE